jgi:hypothetical protein
MSSECMLLHQIFNMYKIITMKILFALLVILLLPFFSFSQLISQFNKTVTFLYTGVPGNQLVPYGTAFLVAIPSKMPNANYIYLVTAKHVLETADKKPLNVIYAKFNTVDSDELFQIPLVWNGPNRNVFLHPDPTVDLAVLPVVLPNNLIYKFIPIEQIGRRSEFDSLHIDIGTEAFFTGLFTSYTGNKNLKPIFRFGRLCLIPDEPIEFDNQYRNLLLIESASFGGNSGSPVIFSYQNGPLTSVRLEGIILGNFNQGQLLGKANDKDIIAWSSMGISAITPSEYILDILNGPELSNRRLQ